MDAPSALTLLLNVVRAAAVEEMAVAIAVAVVAATGAVAVVVATVVAAEVAATVAATVAAAAVAVATATVAATSREDTTKVEVAMAAVAAIELQKIVSHEAVRR